jgi:RES domain-containing protein
MLVHVDPIDLPSDLQAIEIEIPDDIKKAVVSLSSLPDEWQATPGPDCLRDIGSNWVAAAQEAVLVVPSAIVASESNYLVNPVHADAARIVAKVARSFSLDSRLL